ncbi:MAG: cysteine--tRNA ligase [Candidatus Competibacteraceae bacterium]|uniref:Cysteine--tRNA ligase n=1 Tax=Candidatus Contendobacter odensis Run_B_J11 TaxID=1400861 RepID=A0A7U7GA99_9GAMM|nr:cysteine--tRNA ligase [Candidatus Contendobacter odensis]MBK8537440.1 cysteine--tRNA ligase [Candidatus Competibacteraceae bacterium]MBK8751783.1 cysteine--tRNA ligase [Candidatus Competibacteraceae bacterium]CDH44377.1 cysteine tRNA synthetase [Candidatus Contendobacter odensis Run_B_J11]
MLRIFNSLTRQKEEFHPIDAGQVRMYVCGMTVYDYCHVGHARVMVVFDVVLRWLRDKGYDVTYVRNITDIDDKIIRRAQENGEDFHDLTARFIQAMHEDLAALGILPPTHEPRATEAIADIVALIQTLLDKSFAYAGGSGDVYYDVRRFDCYGRLANKKLDDLRAGSRVEIEDDKNDPLDFVLWKAAKPGEPSWPSPWGAGRPGWHIECSAMSTRCLGAHFDIHGGGMDLKFPHHENEIAQSEAASGHRYVNIWMHNGFVQVDDEKMSKSLGNFFTVREVLQRYQPEVVRFFILSSHYRGPLNYANENLEHAKASLTRLYTALRGLPMVEAPVEEGWRTRFEQAMDDDFNTPEALAVLFDLAREINRLRVEDEAAAARLGITLKHLGGALGLLQDDPERLLQGKSIFLVSSILSRSTTSVADLTVATIPEEQINVLIDQRTAARKAKNWAEGDRIRALLQEAGILLEDTPKGTIWRRE